MKILQEYKLVRKIGPLNESGLYEITEKGRKALQHWDLLKEDTSEFKDRVGI